jgi:hypothetical protein
MHRSLAPFAALLGYKETKGKGHDVPQTRGERAPGIEVDDQMESS